MQNKNQKIKKIKGKNLFGEERIYTFKLMNALTGLTLGHKHIFPIINIAPGIIEAFQKISKDESNAKGGLKPGAVAEIMLILEDIMPIEKQLELAKAMLPGATVIVDDSEQTIGDDGIGDYCVGDPAELLASLFYAAQANYPKYINPLLDALDKQGDSTQATPTKK
jgi:hypothetical protein